MPNRSSHTTTGNWRARFASEFYDDQGRQWRVEFIDNDTASGHTEFSLSSTDDPHDVDLTDDGFVLSWDGPTDHLGGSVIPSTCTVEMVLTTNAMENIHSAIKGADDDRFGLAVYINDGSTDWVPWWVGSLVHEAIEYETQDLPNLIRLRASCGLNRLRNIEFSDDGQQYLGKTTFAELIAICLNKIPTANFWVNTDHQLKEVVDIFSTGTVSGGKTWTTTDEDPFPASVLETTLVEAQAFAEQREPKEDEFGRRAHYPFDFNSCHDVLEHITNALGVRMFLSDFSFWTFPVNALNWSHELRVQRWTRSLVSSETIRTTLSSGAYVLTSTTEDVNFEKDIETNHALGMGWSNSYLLPVRRCALTYLNAGQRSVFGNPRNIYIDYPSGNAPTYTILNQDITISEGEVLNIRGTYSTGQLRKEFGSALTGAAFNDYGSDRIGAYIILRLKIKANTEGGTAYYYVSEYNQGDAITIDMPAGFNGDFTNPTLSGFTVGVDDPVWQTTEGFFDIVVPWESSNPPAPTIDHSDGETYVGGLHVFGTDDDEFEYLVNTTQQDLVEHPFDITTAPLPNNLTSYDGLSLTVDRIVLTHNHNVRETFPELENIFTGIAAVNYDHTGASLASYSQTAPQDRVDDLIVGTGANNEDGDITYFVEQAANTEYLDLGDTVIQSAKNGPDPQSDGSVYTLDHSTLAAGVFSPQLVGSFTAFHSITDTIDQNDDADGVDLLTAVCREQLFMRGKPLVTQRGEIVPQEGSSNTTRPFDMTHLLTHNCSTVGDVADYLVPMSMTYNAGTATHSVEAAMIDRVRLSFEADQVVDKGPKGPTPNGQGGPIGPVQQGKGSTSGPIIDGLNTVTKRYDALDTEIVDIQTKTNLITVTGSVDLDNLSSTVSTHTTDIASNTTLANNAQSTANTAATNASTALSRSATNETDITNIEAKTDFMTITQAVDLDDMEGQTNRIKNIPSSPTEARVIRVDTNGDLAAITDGTSGQVLTTDGSGGLSFTTVSGGGSSTAEYVLASTSGRIDLVNPNRLYYGSNEYGWDTDDAFDASSSTTSLSGSYAHAGIALPTDVSRLELLGSVVNLTAAEDVTITLYTGARPNGQTSITLTSVGTDTVPCRTASGRHFDADITAASLSLTAGDLLFVMFSRAGTRTGSQLVSFTYTIRCVE